MTKGGLCQDGGTWGRKEERGSQQNTFAFTLLLSESACAPWNGGQDGCAEILVSARYRLGGESTRKINNFLSFFLQLKTSIKHQESFCILPMSQMAP